MQSRHSSTTCCWSSCYLPTIHSATQRPSFGLRCHQTRTFRHEDARLEVCQTACFQRLSSWKSICLLDHPCMIQAHFTGRIDSIPMTQFQCLRASLWGFTGQACLSWARIHGHPTWHSKFHSLRIFVLQSLGLASWDWCKYLQCPSAAEVTSQTALDE